MSRQVRLRPEASLELASAIRHYDSVHPALGARFQAEAQQELDRRSDGNFEGPPVRRRRDGRVLRRLVVSDFPYSIVYVASTEEVIVLAFAHAKRRPGYWLGRVK